MNRFFEQHTFNVGRGPSFASEATLPRGAPEKLKGRLIAYYLPQFHPIGENNEWWGPGFTEWTNVTKAVPRYRGHLQPRLPADLGFYDLRQSEAIASQASLARRAGVEAFCIHHYWFSGRPVLETPIRLLLENSDIDIRFCLNWANENWTRRWDGSEDDILLHQRYDPGDAEAFARSIVPILKDARYLLIGERPLLMVYRPDLLPDSRAWLEIVRRTLIQEGLASPFFVMPQVFNNEDPRAFGFDAAAGFPPHKSGFHLPNRRRSLELFDPEFKGAALSYKDMVAGALQNIPSDFKLFPGVCPGWDNEARKPGRGTGFFGSSPELYGSWLEGALSIARKTENCEEQIVFVNAWNEWAEGAHLEPDRHFGHAFLVETRRVMDENPIESAGPTSASLPVKPDLLTPRPSLRSLIRNGIHKLAT